MTEQIGMHFIAYYEDEIIHGKPIGELGTGWNNLPDKPICKLEYVNPYGETITLEGCAEYNHFVEVVQQMGGKPYLAKIFLMGADTPLAPPTQKTAGLRLDRGEHTPLSPLDRGEKSVKVYEIMLDEAHLGQVITRKCVKGAEYDGEPSWGWRKGIVSGK